MGDLFALQVGIEFFEEFRTIVCLYRPDRQWTHHFQSSEEVPGVSAGEMTVTRGEGELKPAIYCRYQIPPDTLHKEMATVCLKMPKVTMSWRMFYPKPFVLPATVIHPLAGRIVIDPA